jgi:hypothetical protein
MYPIDIFNNSQVVGEMATFFCARFGFKGEGLCSQDATQKHQNFPCTMPSHGHDGIATHPDTLLQLKDFSLL